MVVIIDDRVDVWERQPNVIEVHPYRFWRDVGDINAPSGAPIHPQQPIPPSQPAAGAPRVVVEPPAEDKTPPVEAKTADGNRGNGEMTQAPAQSNQAVGTTAENAGSTKPESSSDAEKTPLEEKESNNGDGGDDSSDETSSSDSDSDSDGRSSSEESLSSAFGDAEQPGDNPRASLHDFAEHAERVADKDQSAKEAELASSSRGAESGQAAKDTDPDDYLLHLRDILLRIHKSFYEAYDQHTVGDAEEPSTRALLPKLRAETLPNVRLVFSGVIPTDTRQPERHEAWRTAEAFGATVQLSLRGDQAAPGTATTHLVAAKYGTHKVHMAQYMRNVSIVHPDWLWCCAARWERTSEELFRLRPEHRDTVIVTSAEHTPSQTPAPPPDDGTELSPARRLQRHISLSSEERSAMLEEVDNDMDDSSSSSDEAISADDGAEIDSEQDEEGEARSSMKRKRHWEEDEDDADNERSRKLSRGEDNWASSSSESDQSDSSDDEDDPMVNMLEKEIL